MAYLNVKKTNNSLNHKALSRLSNSLFLALGKTNMLDKSCEFASLHLFRSILAKCRRKLVFLSEKKN